MLKKSFLLILFLFLSSCGYEAMYSKKGTMNYDFFIIDLSFEGNRDVNLKIKEKLNNFTLDKKNKKFILKISSTAEKLILAKNASGDPTSFKSTIIIKIEIITENNFKSNIKITESFNYNNDSNKLDLKKYEKEIRNNLSETVADKLIFRLSNTQ